MSKLPRALVLGVRGKLGGAIASQLSEHFKVEGVGRRECDVGDISALEQCLARYHPAFVVNCAAMMGIEACEKGPKEAFCINAIAPQVLGRWCDRNNATLLHFSTDAVFSNLSEGSYTEEDTPRPINVYGATKFAGESLAIAETRRCYIVRTSVLFSENLDSQQIFEKMVQKALRGDPIRIADDVISSPTYTLDIAREVSEILHSKAEYGLYHVVNRGSVSLYGLIQHALARLGCEEMISRCSHEDFSTIGRKNTVTPLRTVRRRPLRPWSEAMDDCLQQLGRKVQAQKTFVG